MGRARTGEARPRRRAKIFLPCGVTLPREGGARPDVARRFREPPGGVSLHGLRSRQASPPPGRGAVAFRGRAANPRLVSTPAPAALRSASTTPDIACAMYGTGSASRRLPRAKAGGRALSCFAAPGAGARRGPGLCRRLSPFATLSALRSLREAASHLRRLASCPRSPAASLRLRSLGGGLRGRGCCSAIMFAIAEYP